MVVQIGRGDVELVVQPRFVVPGQDDESGGFIAPMPGKVIELRVQAGDRVEPGQTVLVLEAMKMEHPIRSTEHGVVTEVLVSEGEQVESGTRLLVVETDEQGEA